MPSGGVSTASRQSTATLLNNLRHPIGSPFALTNRTLKKRSSPDFSTITLPCNGCWRLSSVLTRMLSAPSGFASGFSKTEAGMGGTGMLRRCREVRMRFVSGVAGR
jgi:hypothetical protein